MIKKRKYFWRYLLLSIAAIGILVYLFSPVFGWMVDAVFQRTTALYPEPGMEVIGQYVMDEQPRSGEAPAFRQFILDLNHQSDWPDDAGFGERPTTELPVMVTIRTWSGGNNAYDDNPLLDIREGKYDVLFRRFLESLPNGGAGVYLRFNPEMEVPVSQYPWQQYPSLYVEGYRRFADLTASLAPRAVRVWSPAGYPGAQDYYPGDGVVDAASVTFRYVGEQRLAGYSRDLSAEEELYRRLHRLRFVKVPVYVVLPPEAEGPLPDPEQVLEKLQ